MSLRGIIDEDRRLVILRTLNEADHYRLNESLLERVLATVGVMPAGRDVLRGHLSWLEQNGLVTVEKITVEHGEQLWIATATRAGTEVARGRPYPGVARPSAPG